MQENYVRHLRTYFHYQGEVNHETLDMARARRIIAGLDEGSPPVDVGGLAAELFSSLGMDYRYVPLRLKPGGVGGLYALCDVASSLLLLYASGDG